MQKVQYKIQYNVAKSTELSLFWNFRVEILYLTVMEQFEMSSSLIHVFTKYGILSSVTLAEPSTSSFWNETKKGLKNAFSIVDQEPVMLPGKFLREFQWYCQCSFSS